MFDNRKYVRGGICYAAVNDNIGTAVIEQTVGSWDDDSEAHSVVGLLRLIIEKIQAQLERLAQLENKVDALDTKVDTKIDAQTVSLQQSIEDSVQAANASYNLFVYLPKTDALNEYVGQTVTITSESGNQAAVTTLKDTGTNYSSTLYFNFSGNCELSWTAINELGEEFDITEDITITNSSQEFKLGSVAHRLRVYFPKSVALYAYDDKPIMLIQGDKSFSSVLKDDGTNYSAIIYSDFDGTATLKYDFLDEQGTRVPIEEPVNMTSSQMELEIGLNSLNPSQMSWRTINTILKSDRAELFGLTAEGTQLPDGWYVVGTGTDSEGKLALQLWRKTNLGNQTWSSANSTAASYYSTFNTNTVADLAFKSSLLSKTDVETGWLATTANRNTDVGYWLETASSSSQHYHVRTDGAVNFGIADSASLGCFPCVWIH